jgi:hypothetical protein
MELQHSRVYERARRGTDHADGMANEEETRYYDESNKEMEGKAEH